MQRGTSLYVVRHGETDWNLAERLQGQTDIPLNARGRAQAARNGRVLADLLSDAAVVDFVASPLCRARETMEIVRRALRMPFDGYRLDDRLKEVHFGNWEGRLWDDLLHLDEAGVAAREAEPFGWCAMGGESYSDLAERVGAWLAEVERDTVVATHGGVSRVLRGHLLGLDWRSVPRLKVPQDKFLVLRHGEQRWV
ncbi:MAG: histidine phosphatase family protein [Hyphomicrobiaceae bacterium]